MNCAFKNPLNFTENSAVFKIDFSGDLHENIRAQCGTDRVKEWVHLDFAAKSLEKPTG